MDTGLLIGRVVFGLLMAAHGSQKLFGWFGGYGLAGTAGFFDSLGFRPGRFFTVLASLGELVGGVLIGITQVWTPAVVWTALALGALGGFASLAIRRPAPAAVTA